MAKRAAKKAATRKAPPKRSKSARSRRKAAPRRFLPPPPAATRARAAFAPKATVAALDDATTGELQLSIFDGTRQPIDSSVELRIQIRDGNLNELHNAVHHGPHITFTLPLRNNLADNFIVNVSADDFAQAGFSPVKPRAGLPAVLDLMLLPKRHKLDFERSMWNRLKETHPALTTLFAAGATSAQAAQDRYERLMADRPEALACLLNLTTAMGAIFLPERTPLAYFKQLNWDETMARDRFFGFADTALVRQIELARVQGAFEPEPSPGIFHKGATRSFKQVQFGEANVQLTLHENDTGTIDGVSCVLVEPDIDFFKDLSAHFFLEVIPGLIPGNLTNPLDVYVLRWIAGRHAGVPEFDPPYTVVPM